MSATTADNYDERFGGIDERFNQVDNRFDRIDTRLEKMGDRLNKADKRFDEIDERFEKVDHQFDKLTAFMIKRFDRIEQALEAKADKADLHRALDALDAVMKRQEICDQERLVIMHQLTRHDSWSHELADKIGHKLSPA